jgi:hypothetical protein
VVPELDVVLTGDQHEEVSAPVVGDGDAASREDVRPILAQGLILANDVDWRYAPWSFDYSGPRRGKGSKSDEQP